MVRTIASGGSNGLVVTSPHPPIRSFSPRRRGLSPLRAEVYERTAPRHLLPVEGPLLALATLFPGIPDVVLDIGFGAGEGLVELAAARPTEAVIGVEVHTPGVARVLESIEHHGWQHVRLVEGDVMEFLPRLDHGSLAAVRLFFPDPWLKNKQRHRRIVRPDVLAALVDRLRVGGCLHVATDIADYGRHVMALVADEPRLRGGCIDRPEWRPLTRFEQRGLEAGRTPVDLSFERIR
jgi:tRNA (guanine-N7-)-methyltransferase